MDIMNHLGGVVMKEFVTNNWNLGHQNYFSQKSGEMQVAPVLCREWASVHDIQQALIQCSDIVETPRWGAHFLFSGSLYSSGDDREWTENYNVEWRVCHSKVIHRLLWEPIGMASNLAEDDRHYTHCLAHLLPLNSMLLIFVC